MQLVKTFDEFISVGIKDLSAFCCAIGFHVIKKFEYRIFLFLRGKVNFLDNICLAYVGIIFQPELLAHIFKLWYAKDIPI